MLNLHNAADAIEAHYRYIEWANRSRKMLNIHWETISALKEPSIYHDQMTQIVIESLQDSEVAFVTDGVLELINEAAPLLPTDEVLLSTDTEGRDLSLWLETPLPYSLVTTTDGVTIRENCLVHMINIMHMPLGDNEDPGIWLNLYGVFVSSQEEGKDEEEQEPYDFATYHGLLPVETVAIAFKRPIRESFYDAEWVVGLLLWVVALYRLMGDHIVRSAGQASRPQLKRIHRLGFPPNGYLTEFQLRRIDYEGEGEGTGVPLRFRHRVRGHWRQFYCASLGPVGDPGAYRYKYVHDYVRGPKGTPFIDSTRVITVKR